MGHGKGKMGGFVEGWGRGKGGCLLIYAWVAKSVEKVWGLRIEKPEDGDVHNTFGVLYNNTSQNERKPIQPKISSELRHLVDKRAEIRLFLAKDGRTSEVHGAASKQNAAPEMRVCYQQSKRQRNVHIRARITLCHLMAEIGRVLGLANVSGLALLLSPTHKSL